MIQETQFISGTQRNRGREVSSRELSDLQIFFRDLTPGGVTLTGLEAQGLQWLKRPEGGLDDRNFHPSIHEELL